MKTINIKSIKSLGVKSVYDVEMPTAHNFILDSGIVAHNCEYAHITYACMFLKHHYPLEWWAAILTNAEEQEITGKFWPFVKDMVSPPDINLSTDSMVIDYKNEKIRSKLGIIRGMGEATIEPLLNGRPYKDIQDFVDKEVAGPSLARKLIHVGVLDSLFAPKSSFTEKLMAYEEAVQLKIFRDKKEEAEKKGKKSRILEPKKASLPEEYLNLSPFQDIAMKKSVLPSLPVDMHSIAKKHSKIISRFADSPSVYSKYNKETPLINGSRLKTLDEIPAENVSSDIYIASTCYIVKSEEFSYPKAKPTKRALKLILDVDSYVTEKVLWPSYDSGQLSYPKELGKGKIATVFFKKRAGKQDMSITEIVMET